MAENYDIIIAGAGLSGLSLAWYLAEGGYEGKIVIIDATFAPANDKTWSFWTKDKPPFEDIIYKTWNSLYVSVLDYEHTFALKEYTYNAIRSGDFKEHVLSRIKKLPNVDLIEEGILDMFRKKKKKAVLKTKSGGTFIAKYIFQSVLPPTGLDRTKIKYPLIQHFLGWEIQSNQSVFDPDLPTFMHFDEDWNDGVAFMYTLPYSKNRALFEYTIFSKSMEEEELYEDKIVDYLRENYGLNENEYIVGRKEFGQIPMEDRPYLPWYDKRVMNLGTSAGLPKPSTGYAFMRIQKHVKLLAESLISGSRPVLPTHSKAQFRYYDKLLLHILSTSTTDGLNVFHDLFKNNSIQQVFAFLDEQTNFFEDLRIMNSVPYTPFLKAIRENIRHK